MLLANPASSGFSNRCAREKVLDTDEECIDELGVQQLPLAGGLTPLAQGARSALLWSQTAPGGAIL